MISTYNYNATMPNSPNATCIFAASDTLDLEAQFLTPVPMDAESQSFLLNTNLKGLKGGYRLARRMIMTCISLCLLLVADYEAGLALSVG